MTRTEPASEFVAAVEEAWIARAKLGEREAQQWLLSRYRSRVVRLATHILRRPDEAEDVAQEALVRALTQIKTYRGDAPFSTWLACECALGRCRRRSLGAA